MLKNYFKTALRNLVKNYPYTIINIVGLSTAIACAIVAYINYQFSQSFDSMHENGDKIYRLNSYKIINNSRENWGITPMPLAPSLKSDLPGVKKFSRFHFGNGTFRYEDKIFNETFHFLDRDFFEMFTYPVIYSSEKPLSSENGIVISEEISKKYYGNINPVGEQIILTVNGKKYGFMITAVIENSPKNSSISINIAIPMTRRKDIYDYDIESWELWSRTTFIMLTEKSSIADVKKELNNYYEITLQSNPSWQIDGFYLEPLSQVAFTSRDLYGNSIRGGLHPAAIIGPSITAVLILLLACFNFVNTAVAYSGRRLNEIAIRKVVGCRQGQIIYQFLGENLLLCIVALILGVAISEIFVPAYNSLWPELDLSIDYFKNTGFVLFLISILFFTAIAAGGYPALFVSKFKSVEIFRNKQKLGSTNFLIRSLLIFQFTLSIVTIFGGVVFYRNAEYVKNYDMGFNVYDIMINPVDNEAEYELFRSKIESNPNISRIASSNYLAGFGFALTEAKVDEMDVQLCYEEFGENYIEVMGMDILEGRSFDEKRATDYENSVLVNQAFMRTYGWESIAGKTLKLREEGNEKEYNIIGLLKDFSVNSMYRKIEPTVVVFAKPERCDYLIARFHSSDPDVVLEDLKQTWEKTFPDRAYAGFFQTEIIEEPIRVSNSISTIFLYISLVAVVISAMGLFALISLNVAKRTKEIGIRKVLGATIISIGRLISSEYALLYIIASFLAVISGYYMVSIFISSIYAYYVEFGVIPFILSIFIVLFIGVVTVSSQVYSVATLNPADAIRDE